MNSSKKRGPPAPQSPYLQTGSEIERDMKVALGLSQNYRKGKVSRRAQEGNQLSVPHGVEVKPLQRGISLHPGSGQPVSLDW